MSRTQQFRRPMGGAAAVPAWWQAVAGVTPTAAYAFRGAASYAASLVNLANPGTNDLVLAAGATAPTWDNNDGLSGYNGNNKNLTTGITPAANATILIKLRGIPQSDRWPAGTFSGGIFAASSNMTSFAGIIYVSGGSTGVVVGPRLAYGTFGISGRSGYRNGALDSGAIPTGAAANAGITIGGLSNAGTTVLSGGAIQAVWIHQATLTDGQVATLSAAMQSMTPFAGCVGELIFEGDSLTTGMGSTGGNTYPAQLMALLPTWTSRNVATAGSTLVEMLAQAAAQIDGWIDAAYTTQAVVIWGGSNDIASGSANGLTTYNNLVTYGQARQALGFQVVALTMLPRTDLSAGEETERLDYNTRIRAGWATFADALADVAADGRIGDKGDENDTTYYAVDAIHMNNTGYGVVAGIVQTAIESL